MTIVQDELTEPVNAQDMARNYKQAYEKNDVQKMANKDVASAIAAKASPAFFFLSRGFFMLFADFYRR